MKTYRNVQYETKNTHFIHFTYEPGLYHHSGNKYGRYSLIRSFPEGCLLTTDQFARTVIDELYTRQAKYKAEETRLFTVSKTRAIHTNLKK